MAGPFKTNKESLKWDYLEATSKQSLDRVKSGTASKYDYQKVSQILDQYDKLAKSVFDEALATMSNAAQDMVSKIDADREKKGKAPLSGEAAEALFDLALKRAFHDFGPEIVETLDSLLDRKLDKKLDEQDELTGMRIDYAVEKIQDFISKKSAREELVDDIGAEVEKRFRKSIMDVAQDMKQQVAKNPNAPGLGVAGLLPSFGGLGGKAGGLMSLMRSRLKAGAGGMAKLRAMASGVGGFFSRTKAYGGAMPLANPQAPQLPGPATQNKQTSVLQDINASIKKFIKSTKNAGKAGRDRMQRAFQGMLKKYESMKKFFGDKFGKAKSLAGKGMGWIGNVGKAILTSLIYSPLIKTLMDKFGETFSAENIKEKLGETWDWMKENAPKALDWIWDKVSNFDYKGVAEKVWGWIKEMSSGAWSATKDWAGEKYDLAKKSAGDAKQVITDKVKEFLPEWLGGAKKGGDTSSTVPVSGGAGKGGGSSAPASAASGSSSPASSSKSELPDELMKGATTQAEFEAQKKASDAKAAGKAVVAPSGVSNQYVSNTANLSGVFNGGNTRSAPAQSVMFKSPVTPSTNAPTGSSATPGMPPANKGGKEGVFGLGSFGLVHGVTDTLGLMNLGAVQ